jgi:hypothetical protein
LHGCGTGEDPASSPDGGLIDHLAFMPPCTISIRRRRNVEDRLGSSDFLGRGLKRAPDRRYLSWVNAKFSAETQTAGLGSFAFDDLSLVKPGCDAIDRRRLCRRSRRQH